MYSITEQAVSWLASLGYRAATRPPENAPDAPSEFVTVERTGGAVADLVDHPTVAVQTWAATDTRAEEMANAIRLAALTGSPPRGVHRIECESGPYPFFDEGTRCPRFQTVYRITSQLTD